MCYFLITETMINFDFLSAKLISEPLHAVIWLIAEFEYLPNHL